MRRESLLRIKGVSKNYYSTQALDHVSLEVLPGEIVGLVGENGSGKSTLLKIIMGIEQPTGGEMHIEGTPYAPKSPNDAYQYGIGMVYQEQALITNLTVGQNIFLGHEKEYRRNGYVHWKEVYRDAQLALEAIECGDIAPKQKVYDLNFATRQMVEIAKVFQEAQASKQAHCLILFDEPTSVLSETEVQKLFKQIRGLTAKGHSAIFVSHRLDEVLSISDRIYVLKDGKNVASVPAKEAREDDLFKMMVGKSGSSDFYGKQLETSPDEAPCVLETRELGLEGCFKDVNLRLHQGEVIGICGVVGSGKEELCSVLVGDELPTRGMLLRNGKACSFANPSAALDNGVVMIPKERLVEGIIPSLSIKSNIAFSCFRKIKKGPFLNERKLDDMTAQWTKKLRIVCAGPDQQLLHLSGGNQQKVVFARIMASDADIILLNHPTRGVDVGAKSEIYTIIRELVSQGKSMILLGDTLDECIGLSDRIIVMRDGVITGEFDAGAGAKPSQVDIVKLMM